ncbi:MAG: PmeII family type II restriction endonuclease [Eubacteriales bacterium]|nr:PmeII family type II restriction endonuclease [Eubacteriales bacterium]MDD4683471.1 PmeII family type II restriction endonuclease [Eubacteriales bacterium]
MGFSYFEQLIADEISVSEFTDYAKMVFNDSNDYSELGLNEQEIELFKKLGADAIDDIISARKRKIEIISKWKTFFRETIAENHRINTLKLSNINEFNLNPFLDNYKANFLNGDSSPISKATALVYARVLGSSINTTFGTNLQKFCSDILSAYASTTSGIDIEFNDFVDGRRKYCQIKAGPNTINKDDVKTISDHFVAVKNLARTNNSNIGFNDLVVGVFYGEKHELSSHYKKLSNDYSVFVGQEFWYRLTGDEKFYFELTEAIDEVAAEYDGRELLNSVITKLAIEIEKREAEIK